MNTARETFVALTLWMPKALSLGFLLYLLSYAPVLRLTGECPEQLNSLYGPADSITTSTPLRVPLLTWASAWGVQDRLEHPRWFRNLMKMSDKAREIERRFGIYD